MEAKTSNDYSIRPIESIKLLGFSGRIPKDSITQFRKINSNFFETLAFDLLEQRILKYDANEFNSFVENFKTEASPIHSSSFIKLKTYDHADISQRFENTIKFLESLGDMILNSINDKQQTVKVMTQTFESPEDELLKNLGIFLKAHIINYAEKLRRRNGCLKEICAKYVHAQNFEKELSSDEILTDIRVICESQVINICLINSDGSSCTHHSSKGELVLCLMRFKNEYVILYQDQKFNSQNNAKIPLPPSKIDELVVTSYDDYDNDDTPRKYKIDPINVPSKKDSSSYVKINYESQCCLCHNELIERAFINPICQHKFCFVCLVERTQKQNCSSICYEMRCTKNINLTDIEDYLIEMNLFKEMENTEIVSEKLPCVCTKCQNQDLLCFTTNFMAPEYFVCSKCKDLQCLIHYTSMEVCRCFCNKCKQKLDDFPNIKQRFCKICQTAYCLICNLEKKECKCFCQGCNSKKSEAKDRCDICERECVNCHTPYGVDLLRLAECGKHLLCRCCRIRGILHEISDENEGKCGVC